ncbi:MAG TPA: hypothetical protein VFC19_46655 [Candidatus Limnocylindrales bacterium]|nr:hypothetical protein [Candidatus Limnocylindrales bacterium]
MSRSVPVPAGRGLSFVQVAAGYRHTCATDALGQAYCWGNNSVGQASDGTLATQLQPTRVSIGAVATIAVGFDHSCAVGVDSALSCWGFNGSGQDGDGTTDNLPTPTYVGQHL